MFQTNNQNGVFNFFLCITKMLTMRRVKEKKMKHNPMMRLPLTEVFYTMRFLDKTLYVPILNGVRQEHFG